MPDCHWLSSNYSVPTSCICKPALGCGHWAYTSRQQTASTYSWICHTGFLLQCSALGKGLLIENQRSSVRASLRIRDAAIIWPLFQQSCDVKDLRPQARLSRQTVSASVGSRGQLFFFFFFFFVSDLTSTRKCVLCSFHRRLKHQHCVCSYVTEWQLLWRTWSCASGHLCLWQEKKSLHKV